MSDSIANTTVGRGRTLPNPFTAAPPLPLPDDLVQTDESQHDMNLNLSIDVVSRVKPVDMSNLEEFERVREEEYREEELSRERIEREDRAYFEGLKEKDLGSPLDAKDTLRVLYDPENDEEEVTVVDGHVMRTLSVQTDLSISPIAEVGLFTYQEQAEREQEIILQEQQRQENLQHEQQCGNAHLMTPFRDATSTQLPTPLKSAAEALAFLSPIGGGAEARNRNVLLATPGYSPYSRGQYQEERVMKTPLRHDEHVVPTEADSFYPQGLQNSRHASWDGYSQSQPTGGIDSFQSRNSQNGKQRSRRTIAKKLQFDGNGDSDEYDDDDDDFNSEQRPYEGSTEDVYNSDILLSEVRKSPSDKRQRRRRQKVKSKTPLDTSLQQQQQFHSSENDNIHQHHSVQPIIQCPHCHQQMMCNISVTPVTSHISTGSNRPEFMTPVTDRRHFSQQHPSSTQHYPTYSHHQFPYSYSTGTKYRSLYSPPLPPLYHIDNYSNSPGITNVNTSPPGRKPLSPSNFEFLRQRYYKYYEERNQMYN